MALHPCEALKKIRAALGTGAVTPEALARAFHEAYERLAPEHGYETRRPSAVPWEQVPEQNRTLMIATAAAILQNDASAEIRAILEEVNDSLPEIYRK